MKLTAKEVEVIENNGFKNLEQLHDLCRGWLAMRKMLESLESVHFCPSCKADRGIGWHKNDCKLKELLGCS